MLERVAAESHLLANHSATTRCSDAGSTNTPNSLIEKQLRDVARADRAFDEVRRQVLLPRSVRFLARGAHADILNADRTLRNYIGPVYWDIGGDIAKERRRLHHEFRRLGLLAPTVGPSTCAKGYLREIRRKNGGVVLMHCISSQAGELVADVIPAMLEEGYEFVRLDQVPEYRQYETPAPVAGESFIRAASLDQTNLK